MVGAVRLRTKGLLLGWISGLAAFPGNLSLDQETVCNRRISIAIRLLLGGVTTDGTSRINRVDAFSSAGANEKTESTASVILEI
jgi:hypothetical protein